MPTKKVTGGYVTVSKAGKVGTKVFTSKANAERVQRAARKNLGKTRGGKAAAKPKGTGSKKKNPAPATAASPAAPAKPPRMGAIYQTAKVTGQAAVPLTDYALIPGPKTADGLILHARDHADFDLAKGYAVAAADAALSKSRLVGHAGALSRKSVTALAPEAYLALQGVEDARAKLSPQVIHNNASIATMGYAPFEAKGTRFKWTNDRFRTYHKLKWGLAAVRAAANRTKIGGRIAGPIKKVLSMLGGAI